MYLKFIFGVTLLLACVENIHSVSVPFIRKCKVEDSKCLKESTQAAIPAFAPGIPELGIETMDPLKFSELDASSATLKLLLKDVVGTGLNQCVAKKVKLSDNRDKIFVKFLCTVEFHAQYQMDGNLLVLRMSGEGKAYLLLNKIQISVEADLDEVQGKDGLTHWAIKSFKHTYELKDKSKIDLENLFNGNEALGRAARDLLASSPNEIIDEVGPPVIRKVAEKIVKNVNKLFSKVELAELIESS